MNNVCKKFHAAIVPMTLSYNYNHQVLNRWSMFLTCYTNIHLGRFHFVVRLLMCMKSVPDVNRDSTMSYSFQWLMYTNKSTVHLHVVNGLMECQSPYNSYGMGSAKSLLHGIQIFNDKQTNKQNINTLQSSSIKKMFAMTFLNWFLVI